MFNKESTAAVLMVDTSNSFNAINWEALLHNKKYFARQYQHISTTAILVTNKRYIQGGRSIKSEEGTTQSDPTTMVIYALGITLLLVWLSRKSNEGESTSASKLVAFADDLNVIGTVESLKKWWSLLEEGGKISYNVNEKKSYLFVK